MYKISDLSYTRADMLADLRAGVAPLEAAHRKWTALLDGGEDFGTSSCACCETYFDYEDKRACLSKCPLGNTEGCCSGSYGKWVKHQNEKHMDDYISYAIRCPECETIARNIHGAISGQLERGRKTPAAMKETG